jgi:hypothetical protein
MTFKAFLTELSVFTEAKSRCRVDALMMAVYHSLSDQRLHSWPSSTLDTSAKESMGKGAAIACASSTRARAKVIDSLAEVSSVELGHESTGFVCHVNDNTAVDISRNIPQQSHSSAGRGLEQSLI